MVTKGIKDTKEIGDIKALSRAKQAALGVSLKSEQTLYIL